MAQKGPELKAGSFFSFCKIQGIEIALTMAVIIAKKRERLKTKPIYN